MRPNANEYRRAALLALLLGAAHGVIAAPEDAAQGAGTSTDTAPPATVQPAAVPEQVLLRRLEEFIDSLRGKPLEPGCMEG